MEMLVSDLKPRPGPQCPGHSFICSRDMTGVAGDTGVVAVPKVTVPKVTVPKVTVPKVTVPGRQGAEGDVAAGSRGSARTAVTVNECSIQPFLPQLFFLGQESLPLPLPLPLLLSLSLSLSLSL